MDLNGHLKPLVCQILGGFISIQSAAASVQVRGVSACSTNTPTAAQHRRKKDNQKEPDFRDGYRQRQEEITEEPSSQMCTLISFFNKYVRTAQIKLPLPFTTSSELESVVTFAMAGAHLHPAGEEIRHLLSCLEGGSLM